VLVFIFAGSGEWACHSLLAVAGIWVVGPPALYVSSKFEKPMKRDTAQGS
jgi:hypothetical protein